MAKKLEPKEPVVISRETPPEVDSSPVDFTHTALSIVKRDQVLTLVRIRYNPETGATGRVEIMKESTIPGEIQNAFRIAAAKEIF